MQRYCFLVLALCLGLSHAWAYPVTWGSSSTMGTYASVGYFSPTNSSAVEADGTVDHFRGGPSFTLGDFFEKRRSSMLGVEFTVAQAQYSDNSYGDHGYYDYYSNDAIITRLLLIDRVRLGRSLFIEGGFGVTHVDWSDPGDNSFTNFAYRVGVGVNLGDNGGFIRVDWDPSIANDNLNSDSTVTRNISNGITTSVGLIF